MENIIQKINKIGHYLNISSESFMLFALVCIFAIPFVIAKSIEPAVQTDSSSNIAYIYVPVNNSNTNFAVNANQDSAFQETQQDENQERLANTDENTPNVLGLVLENNNVFLSKDAEDSLNVSLIDKYEYMFDKFEYSVTSNDEYRLRISSSKQMDGVEILRVANSSDKSLLFSVDVRSFSGDVQFVKLQIGDVIVNISDVVWPQYFTIEPSQEISIFFSYYSVKPFDIDILVRNY